MYGYMGKSLTIDLTKNQFSTEPLDRERARKFLGGRGLGARALFDHDITVDAFDEKNPVIIATGPLTGALFTGSKFVFITKSPLTGIFNDSYCGGSFASEIKFAGYDMITILGKAAKPSYIYIYNDKIEVRDAGHLWGLGSDETESALKKELGREFKVVTIGPAGEKLVPYACVSTDFYHQAGRAGAGAVLGAKNIKAIAIKGSQGIKVAEPDKLFSFVVNELPVMFKNSVFGENRIRYGTSYTTTSTNALGIMPTRNFQTGTFENIDDINAFAMRERIVERDKACYGCQVPCGKYSVVKKGKYVGTKVVGPEYETIGLLGSNCGVGEIEAIAKANLLCDQLGLDTMSAGSAIAFAMECFERGILTKDDVDGLDLRFGNDDAQMELIRKIAFREGIGDILAQGVKKASEIIGKGSEEFAIHSKGLELAAYDPRGAFAMGLAYATASRGGCHRRAKPVDVPGLSQDEYSSFGWKGNAALVERLQDFREIVHSALICDPALRFGFEMKLKGLTDVINMVTGMDFTFDELSLMADRIATLARAYNVKQGITRKDDTLPSRILNQPLPEGPGKGQIIGQETMDRMLDEYYELRGWDKETGVPTKETLERMGLDFIEL
ncbi:MAG: Tungsten-containing aldehyde:ferredoxin oxidoreductase [Firmicutes bacterium]|nr:Tungsten-containing aldehyde:ferredoxin oxidoreductase [Bacillota bacterium]